MCFNSWHCVCLLMLNDQYFNCLLTGWVVSCIIKKKVSILENITNYVLTLGSTFGIIDEKAIVSKMGICHSCLTYFGVTRGVGCTFWPGRSGSCKYLQVDTYE